MVTPMEAMEASLRAALERVLAVLAVQAAVPAVHLQMAVLVALH